MDAPETKRVSGRPKRPEYRSSTNVTVRFSDEVDRALKRQSARHQRSLGGQLSALVMDAESKPPLPPEIDALAELVGRVMVEAGEGIAKTNRTAGYEQKPWMDDPYAWNQSIRAAVYSLELTLLPLPDAPHGLFAAADYPQELARQHGRQIADGVLEVLRGRHNDPGATAAVWTPRIREKLGALADRLVNRPEPPEYFVTTREVGGEVEADDPAAPAGRAPRRPKVGGKG